MTIATHTHQPVPVFVRADHPHFLLRTLNFFGSNLLNQPAQSLITSRGNDMTNMVENLLLQCEHFCRALRKHTLLQRKLLHLVWMASFVSGYTCMASIASVPEFAYRCTCNHLIRVKQMENLAMSIKKFCFQRFCFRCPWCSFPYVRMRYKPQHARTEQVLQQEVTSLVRLVRRLSRARQAIAPCMTVQ